MRARAERQVLSAGAEQRKGKLQVVAVEAEPDQPTAPSAPAAAPPAPPAMVPPVSRASAGSSTQAASTVGMLHAVALLVSIRLQLMMVLLGFIVLASMAMTRQTTASLEVLGIYSLVVGLMVLLERSARRKA